MDVFSSSTLIIAASGTGFMDLNTRRGDLQCNTYIGAFFDQVGRLAYPGDLFRIPRNFTHVQIAFRRNGQCPLDRSLVAQSSAEPRQLAQLFVKFREQCRTLGIKLVAGIERP